MTSVCREFGKRLEDRLYSEWGGKPSTQLLRHRDRTIESVTKLRYHAFLAGKIGQVFPDSEQETQSPEKADDLFSRKHTMYGKADELVAFRLMPLEPQFQKFDANWSFQVIDSNCRLVAFRDESTGKVNSWKWDFGDGTISTEQNPIHQYREGKDYTVALEVQGPEGKSRREKIWDVSVR